MYRIFTLTIIAFLFGAAALHAQDVYRVTADKLNVRESKSSASKITGFIPQNENVVVLDSTDREFFKVKVTNGEGWVSSKFLVKVSSTPVKKVQVEEKKTLAPKTNYNVNYVVVGIVGLVLLGMLLLIFTYLRNNIPLLILSSVIVLAIGYLTFTMLIPQHHISGKYTSGDDVQYRSFDFKSKDSVAILDAYTDSAFTVHYQIEGDRITFKQQENTFMLLIIDQNTLVGEGFTKGIFNKK